jgi:hypothetical protein
MRWPAGIANGITQADRRERDSGRSAMKLAVSSGPSVAQLDFVLFQAAAGLVNEWWRLG